MWIFLLILIVLGSILLTCPGIGSKLREMTNERYLQRYLSYNKSLLNRLSTEFRVDIRFESLKESIPGYIWIDESTLESHVVFINTSFPYLCLKSQINPLLVIIHEIAHLISYRRKKDKFNPMSVTEEINAYLIGWAIIKHCNLSISKSQWRLTLHNQDFFAYTL